ncbi:MAG: hypothetical protein IRZ13_19365 [Acetobacteraceae bacterium]|mgnify:CR=1 FL=1|nr:hypothetical protein [Acetobacteraceae bacterium]
MTRRPNTNTGRSDPVRGRIFSLPTSPFLVDTLSLLARAAVIGLAVITVLFSLNLAGVPPR